MDRRARADVTLPLLMPEGDVIAGLFEKNGDAVALTRPARVQIGGTVLVNPQPPRNGCDILAVFDRAGLRPRSQADDAVIVLRTANGDRAPDVLSDTANRVIAVWYGVPDRSGELIFQSTAERVPSESLRLTPGRVATVRREIARLPAADIDIHAPERFAQMKLDIQSTAHGEPQTIRTVEVVPGSTHLESLPAEILKLELSAGAWQFHQNIDLTSGVDGRVSFDIQPLTVEGRVFLGENASAGELAWGTGKHELVKAEADVNGRYRVDLLAPGVYYARVLVPGHEPLVQTFLSIDEPHTEIDLHVPDNRFRVHVTDRYTGKPIGGAKVTVSSKYKDQGDFKQVESRQAGEDGVANLPPLREGLVEIQAVADRYQVSSAIAFDLDASNKGQQLEIALAPFGEESHLQILDATGRPAFGAELRLIAGSNDDRPLWQGVQDAAEGVNVPLIRDQALLLIRHHGSASRVIAMSRDLGPEIRLGVEAAPLVIRAQAIDGDPAPFARSGMWFGAYRMTTMSLGFLTWSQSGVASREGVWVARGLVPTAARMFVWRHGTATAVAGGFDALATTVSYPWPEVVTLRTVD